MLKVAIGRQVRSFRTKLGITGMELSATSGLSLGMLSKIENGTVSPSLTTLLALSRGLGVPISAFFRHYEEERKAVFVKADEGVYAEHHYADAGHQYKLLGQVRSNTSGVVVEPYLVTHRKESDSFETLHRDGVKFLYLLEGQLDYHHDGILYSMMQGDSLLFNADVPHGQEYLKQLPVRYLSIVSYPQGKSGG